MTTYSRLNDLLVKVRSNRFNLKEKSSEDILNLKILSWNEMYNLLLNLADIIEKSEFKADMIVGISRGGWIPARILADLLDIPKLANITVEFYVGIAKTKKKPTITQSVSLPVKEKKVLIVDDLADTGESLKLVSSYLKNQGASEVKLATIFYKPWSVIVPHYFPQKTSQWVVFPWEIKETVKRLIGEGKNVENLKKKFNSSIKNMEFLDKLIQKVISEKD